MSDRNRKHVTIALAAGAILAVALGLRQAQPLFIGSLNSHTGIGYAAISLAFGIAQLVWGLAQPVAGAVADRWGPRWVMIAGVVLLAGANAAMPLAGSAVALTLLIGVLFAAGAGAVGPAMLISAANRWIPEAKRSVTTGIINAGGSFGQFTIIPLAQLLIGIAGWQPAMIMLGVVGLAALPLVMLLTPSAAESSPAGGSGGVTLGVALREAVRDPSFLLLNAGFLVCGFHVAFIATHLPGVVALCGLPASVSAWSLSVIGLFNMMGSLWMGKAIQKRSMKNALAAVYFARALLVFAFLFAPKTPVAFLLFSAGIGFTYFSTVPPTAGLVAKLHGTRYLATLFGIVMLSHQVGGFLGAWLGGKAFEATRSYDWMWLADIMLCLFAVIVHLPIREARSVPSAAPA
ncbi:MAG TPA: MFS transporter [Burkholderiales bacterium]|nr:MFS transporter [Burkholderiales bacterium]